MILTLKEMERTRDLMNEVIAGLRGRPFRWASNQRKKRMRALEEAGVVLVTSTGLAKRGLALKRGASAVGTVYFGAPLKRTADVFVVDVQTVPTPTPKKTRPSVRSNTPNRTE